MAGQRFSHGPKAVCFFGEFFLSACGLEGSTNETLASYVFASSTASGWHSSKHEQAAFLAEMVHEDSTNSNHTWRMRVGPSGNINSFIGPYGEAMPPQKHDKAPWIDEVWQMVAVGTTTNNLPPYNKAYFIHQAGTYQKDSTTITDPFHSPTVAKRCRLGNGSTGQSCSFAAWGQHAHVPTPFVSTLIYYTRYRDCGGGVLEVTYAMHNSAGPSNDGRTLNFSVPRVPLLLRVASISASLNC